MLAFGPQVDTLRTISESQLTKWSRGFRVSDLDAGWAIDELTASLRGPMVRRSSVKRADGFCGVTPVVGTCSGIADVSIPDQSNAAGLLHMSPWGRSKRTGFAGAVWGERTAQQGLGNALVSENLNAGTPVKTSPFAKVSGASPCQNPVCASKKSMHIHE